VLFYYTSNASKLSTCGRGGRRRGGRLAPAPAGAVPLLH
jgi:hypothetical protein